MTCFPKLERLLIINILRKITSEKYLSLLKKYDDVWENILRTKMEKCTQQNTKVQSKISILCLKLL